MKITRIARILPIALVLFAVLVGSAGATRPQSHAPYTPKHGKCRKGWYRVVLNPRIHKHRIVICYKNKAKKPPPAPITPQAKPRVRLFAHLSSGRQRDLLNPFKVTYGFSATAAKESAATASFSEEIPPPSGVLALYTDGKLECAVNVTEGQTAGSCPVTYPALGEHTVTSIYTAGEESSTVTEVEEVGPIQTSTEVHVSFKEEPPTETDRTLLGFMTVTFASTPGDQLANITLDLPIPGEGSWNGKEGLSPTQSPTVVEVVQAACPNGDPCVRLRQGSTLTKAQPFDYFNGGSTITASRQFGGGYTSSRGYEFINLGITPR